MSAVETAPDVVATRTLKARPKRPATVDLGRFVLWLVVLLVGVGTLLPITGFALRELKTWALVHADDQTIRSELAAEWPDRTSAAWLETLAELGLQIEPPNAERSMWAAMRATAKDPFRGGAWAIQELIRWRFNFVLANWTAVPEPLRRKAFEHADILRWMGDNSEFLAEMRIKAKQAGIPYDIYRSEVNTPVRSWDLEPVERRNAPGGASTDG
jgi:hypothetical protein